MKTFHCLNILSFIQKIKPEIKREQFCRQKKLPDALEHFQFLSVV